MSNYTSPDGPPVVVRPDGLKGYWKAILAAAVPIAYTVSELISDATGDGVWTAQDTKAVLLGVVGAVLVYAKANQTRPNIEIRDAAPGAR